MLAQIHARRPGRGRARRARTPGGVHRAAAEAVVLAVGEVEDPRAAAHRRRVPPPHGPHPSADRAASIVHGDYRLDNCMVSADGRIAAVLDWEICTLGDPLADVGLLMVYWTGPDDWEGGLATSATAVEGFPNRADLLERYAKISGTRRRRHRLLHRVRVLEAGLHRRGRLRAVRRRSDGLRARGLRDVQGAGRAQRRERRGDRAAGVVSDGAAAPLYELHSRPDPRLTGARRRARGLDRRGARCGRGGAGPRRRPPPDRDRDVRRRPAARLPRTTPRDAPPRRREHVAHLARHRALRREGPRRARRAACSSGTSPTRSGSCSPSRWSRSRVDFGTRLVVGLGAYPFAAPHTRPSRLSTTAQLDRARRTPRLPAQLGRRPRGSRGGDRAELRRDRVARRGALGAGAALRGRDALSPGFDRADRRARAGGRPVAPGRGLTEAGSLRAHRPSRRAGLAERRAPRDVATARSTGRRRVGGVDRTHVARSASTRATC